MSMKNLAYQAFKCINAYGDGLKGLWGLLTSLRISISCAILDIGHDYFVLFWYISWYELFHLKGVTVKWCIQFYRKGKGYVCWYHAWSPLHAQISKTSNFTHSFTRSSIAQHTLFHAHMHYHYCLSSQSSVGIGSGQRSGDIKQRALHKERRWVDGSAIEETKGDELIDWARMDEWRKTHLVPVTCW